jgi:hypothetical protein
MEVRAQLHASGKELQVPVGYEAGWTPEPVTHGEEEKKSLPLTGIEPSPFSLQPRKLKIVAAQE